MHAQLKRKPEVVALPPQSLLLLGRECGYGVEAVPAGLAWEPPQTMVDLSTVESARGLAVSGAALRTLLGEQPDEAQPPMLGTEASARAAAADAVRRALLAPTHRISAALQCGATGGRAMGGLARVLQQVLLQQVRGGSSAQEEEDDAGATTRHSVDRRKNDEEEEREEEEKKRS